MSEAWPPYTSEADTLARAATHFVADIAQHTLEVVSDAHGVTYLQARRPDERAYWFDVTATPTSVTINGDMGAFVFMRHGNPDQLALFRARHLNVHYWSEKCVAGEKDRFSLDAYCESVIAVASEHIDYLRDSHDDAGVEAAVAQFRAEVTEQLFPAWLDDESPEDAYQRLFDCTVDGIGIEAGDVKLERFTFQYLWCLHALRWATAAYDAQKADLAA